ncbi:MAG: alcohol dehydrogenase catalytic domain-containing protein, partial [Rhodospirillaceae bacterium]
MTESGSKGQTMMAVLTTGSGGYDKLSYQAVAMPEPGPGELLIKVLAAGVNNTDVNTRLGWYSAAVKGGTDETDANSEGWDKGGWNGETPFPFIQGADCCGRVVRPGPGATDALVGKRVLVRSCIRLNGFADMASRWWGVDSNGAFAQYTVAPESEVFAIESDWSDAELATIPCAYGTAENMLHRAGVAAGMTVLVTGASGGVGSAALQLAKRRGAKVITVAGRDKRDFVLGLGADQALAREDDPEAVLGPESVDVVLDLVVGAGFAGLLEVLRRGGTYVT